MFNKIVYFMTLLPLLVSAEGSIPEPILPPPLFVPVSTVHAKGVQIFQCSLVRGIFSWQLQAPDALLYDDHYQVVGKHYSGPVWEYKEGSLVVGRVVKKIDVSPDTAISWLLVEVVSHKGNGFFLKVRYINRINTIGGLTPLSGCNSNHLGSEKRVPYTADYVFYSTP